MNLRKKTRRKLAFIFDEKLEDQKAQALQHYEKYLELGGSDPAIRARVAELRRASDTVTLQENAVQMLKRSLDTEEGRREYATKEVQAEIERQAGLLLQVADKLRREGKEAEAVAVLQEIISRFPGTIAAEDAASALED